MPALAFPRLCRRSPRSAAPRLPHYRRRVPAASTWLLAPCARSALVVVGAAATGSGGGATAAVATAEPVAPLPPLRPPSPPSPQPTTTTARCRRDRYLQAGTAVGEAAAAVGGASRSTPTTADGTLDVGGTAQCGGIRDHRWCSRSRAGCLRGAVLRPMLPGKGDGGGGVLCWVLTLLPPSGSITDMMVAAKVVVHMGTGGVL